MNQSAFGDFLSTLRLSGEPLELSDARWEAVVRLARNSGLAARLAIYAETFGRFTAPTYVMQNLQSAQIYWQSQKRLVGWELYELQRVCTSVGIPLIVLKGSAYSAAGLYAGLGRVFNDIDILVPKNKLNEFREALKFHGWFQIPLDRYDQNYYENWMHELPPMRHIKRGTTLDVHHNILPETCHLCPDARWLLNAVVPIEGTAYWMLSPEDLVLHSASHLILGGEFDNGLRDLSDIDLLIKQFSDSVSGFLHNLVMRAEQLGLSLPLLYGLYLCRLLLATPISDETLNALQASAKVGQWRLRWMGMLFGYAMKPVHPLCDDAAAMIARWLLYVRSHWLKMPPHLLIPHLLRKAWIRVTNSEKR